MRVIKILVAILLMLVSAAASFPFIFPEKATELAVNAERYRSGLVRKEIDLPGGLHYVYLEGGQGEPLMLLHGFGADKDTFTRAARFLTPHYRVIIPDHIGFGESSHPPEADYSPPAQVERLRSLAQALGIKTVHLGGSSMGGQISLTYAALYPAEVKSLWLLGPAGIWSAPQSEVFKIIAQTGHNPLLAKNEDEFAQVFSFAMSDPPFIPRPMMDVMAQQRIKNYPLEQRIFKQISDFHVERIIPALPTPTLIVFGDHDRAIPVATAEILHRLLPNSKVIIMPGLGHLPMLEKPQQSALDYLRFREALPG